jgi:hypothetical protein
MTDDATDHAAPAHPPGFVPLSTPIEAHGETLTALTLRKPNGKDIRVTGMPFRMSSSDESIITDAAVVHRYIANLGGIPPSVVDRLSPVDFFTAMGVVLGFFGVAPGDQATPKA